MRNRCLPAALLLFVTVPWAAAAQQPAAPAGPTTKPAAGGAPVPAGDVLTVSGAGRTIAVSTDVRRGDLRVRVLDTAQSVSICNGTTKVPLGKLKLRYLVLPDVPAPRELAESEGELIENPTNGVFTLKPVEDGQFVVINLLRAPSPEAGSEAVKKCWASIGEAKGKQEEREQAVKDADEVVKKTQALIATLRPRLESQRADAATYGGRAESADRIAEILKQVAETRTALTKAEADLATQQQALADAQKALADTPDEISGNLGMSLKDAEYTVTMLAAGALLKVGGVLVPPSKGIYYDFATYSPRSSLQLMPIGNYPVVRYGEREFAVIANVVTADHPFGFYLSATAQDGAVVNTDPVRPTFTVAGGEAALRGAPLPTRRATSKTYVDVVLPIRGAFAPNQYPEVTISTERATDDDPKKRATVTLVDKAKYPQFRALYRYNFNTGVFGSGLRSSEFTKVKTKDDDPATDKVDESRYRIQETKSEAQVKPIFAFTYYIVPVDIQAPVSHERWIPNPTIGFAFANPADNIYFGFSHEILRNAQLFWGWHWGQVTELVARNDISEDQDSSAPSTREKRDKAFGIGLTFNVAVITKIFK